MSRETSGHTCDPPAAVKTETRPGHTVSEGGRSRAARASVFMITLVDQSPAYFHQAQSKRVSAEQTTEFFRVLPCEGREHCGRSPFDKRDVRTVVAKLVRRHCPHHNTHSHYIDRCYPTPRSWLLLSLSGRTGKIVTRTLPWVESCKGVFCNVQVFSAGYSEC